MEPKPENVRRSSASSSPDEASCSSAVAGLKGAGGGECCCVPHDGECCSLPHCSKESSGASGDKSCKGKLWRSSSRGGGKFSNKQGGSEVQLLEQRSTNSSEFESPSLSGSLPSVATSHCSHLSLELSCSDPETSRAAHALYPSSPDAPLPAGAFGEAAVASMPEVEHDRLEQCPSKATALIQHLLSSPPASPKEGRDLYRSEEGGDAVTDAEDKDDKVLIPTKNMAATPENSRRKHCIQTDI